MNFRLASLDSINLSFMSSQRRWIVMVISSGGWSSPQWSDSRLLWSVRSGSLGTFTFSSQFLPLTAHSVNLQSIVSPQSPQQRELYFVVCDNFCVLQPHLWHVWNVKGELNILTSLKSLSFLSIMCHSAHETSHFRAPLRPDTLCCK